MKYFRWALVLPIAIAAAYIAFLATYNVIGYFYDDALPARRQPIVATLLDFLPRQVLGMGFVYFGALTAPDYRVQTAQVLAALTIVNAIFLAYQLPTETASFKYLLFLASPMGALFVASNIRRNRNIWMDNPRFWKVIRSHPDYARELFLNGTEWRVFYEEPHDGYKSAVPNDEWMGPFRVYLRDRQTGYGRWAHVFGRRSEMGGSGYKFMKMMRDRGLTQLHY